MRDVLRRYRPTNGGRPDRAERAFYRPGPIQGGMIDDFIERKWGRRKVEYELPELEKILKETLGRESCIRSRLMQIAKPLLGGATRWARPTCLRRRHGQEEMPRRWPSSACASRPGAAERKHPQGQGDSHLST